MAAVALVVRARRAPAAWCCGAGGWPRSRRGSRARSPPACGRRCRGRRGCGPARGLLRPRGLDHRGAALAAGDEADVRDAGLERRGQRLLLVAAVGGDDDRRVVGRVSSACGDVVAGAAAQLGKRGRDRRVADHAQARLRQVRLEEDLQRAAADAGVVDGDGAVDRILARPVPGSIRSSSASPVSSTRRAWRRTLGSAQWPPTKPSMLPSPRTSAVAPTLDARRPRGAHHGGLHVRDALGLEGRGAVGEPLGDHAASSMSITPEGPTQLTTQQKIVESASVLSEIV